MRQQGQTINHSLSFSSSSVFSWGGFAGFFGRGYFLVWLRMKIALSRSFLLMRTESIFFRSGRMEMARMRKFGTAANGLPWMLMVFNLVNCFSFYSSAKSTRKLQWMQRVFRSTKCSKAQSRVVRQLWETSIHCNLVISSIMDPRTRLSPVSSLSLLYPSISDEQTSFTWIAFFFFFQSYYLAFSEMFFMAEVVTMVDTTVFMLFCGSSFITSFFFLSPRASPSSAPSACYSSFSFLVGLALGSSSGYFFSP